MFDPLFEWIGKAFKSIISFIWNTVFKPLWNLLFSWLGAVLTLFFGLLSGLKNALDWIVAAVAKLFSLIAVFGGSPINNPVWGAAGGTVGKINHFIPLAEFIAMLQITVTLCTAMLIIKIINWVRHFLLP